jgi:hypothetical protein
MGRRNQSENKLIVFGLFVDEFVFQEDKKGNEAPPSTFTVSIDDAERDAKLKVTIFGSFV